MVKYKIAFLFSFTLFSAQERQFASQPRWDERFNFEQIEQILRSDKVCQQVKMAEYLREHNKECSFDNAVYLVTLESGLKAVFKPGSDCYAEVAAYRACKFLDMHLVPPTVLHVINNELGSLQFFVESDFDLLNRETYRSLFNQLDPHDISAMRIFYFVFGQWDIGPGNQVIQANNGKVYLALIDNAGLNNKQQIQYGDFAFVQRGWSDKRSDKEDIPFPFDTPSKFINCSLEAIRQVFSEFMAEEHILRLWQKEKTITYCIWRNSLWIQYYKNGSYSPNAVAVYDTSLINAYKKLTKKELEKCWKEALETEDKGHFEKLIELTLARKDIFMLNALRKQGNPTE